MSGSVFASLFVFGAPSLAFRVVDPGSGFAATTLVSSGHRSANSNAVGGGTIVGKLVSMTTRSGNFSIELILMTGLSVTARTGSTTGCGRYQSNPNSNSKRALPTKPKYLIKGIGRLLSGRPLGSYCW